MVDQQTRKIFDLINSRDLLEVKELLRKYPYIEKITRDGSKVYARAISDVLPEAIQIADRFHLFKNLTDALKKDLLPLLPKYVVNSNDDDRNDPIKPTKKERELLERSYHQQELVQLLRKRYKECGRIHLLQAEFNLSYRTVRKYLDNDPIPQRHETICSLTPYFKVISESWLQGEKISKIFHKIKELGYTGSYSNLIK